MLLGIVGVVPVPIPVNEPEIMLKKGRGREGQIGREREGHTRRT